MSEAEWRAEGRWEKVRIIDKADELLARREALVGPPRVAQTRDLHQLVLDAHVHARGTDCHAPAPQLRLAAQHLEEGLNVRRVDENEPTTPVSNL